MRLLVAAVAHWRSGVSKWPVWPKLSLYGCWGELACAHTASTQAKVASILVSDSTIGGMWCSAATVVRRVDTVTEPSPQPFARGPLGQRIRSGCGGLLVRGECG